MIDLEIVLAGAAHPEILSHLHTEAFQSVGERGWSADAFQSALAIPGTAAFIAMMAGEPVAMALVRRVLDEAEILTFCTRPGYRQRGVGKALLEVLVPVAQEAGTDSLFLEVRQDNEAAIRMYRSAGFLETGVRENYFTLLDGSRRDAVLMKLDLTGLD